MTPNLPPHLQESIEEKFRIKWFSGSEWHHNSQTAITISKHSNSYLLELEGYIAGYQQAYADILQELGPVVETLRLIAAIHCDYRVFDSETHERLIECIVADTDAAREALKHLKERILHGNNT